MVVGDFLVRQTVLNHFAEKLWSLHNQIKQLGIFINII